MRNEAQLCPVCHGTGEVFHSTTPDATSTLRDSGGYYRVCHGCGGSGWVTVPQPERFEREG